MTIGDQSAMMLITSGLPGAKAVAVSSTCAEHPKAARATTTGRCSHADLEAIRSTGLFMLDGLTAGDPAEELIEAVTTAKK